MIKSLVLKRRLTATAMVTALTAAALTASPAAAYPAPSPEGYTLFGKSDTVFGITYDSFRIPSIIRTAGSTLVAFAEGRVDNEGDWGNIDLVMKYSLDDGVTWSSLQPVATGGTDTWGNPTPVYAPDPDPATGGTIWLFAQRTDGDRNKDNCCTYAQRQVWSMAMHVGPNGAAPTGTWVFTNRNSALKPDLPEVPTPYGWDSVGPGNGIRLTRGDNAGALVIPAWGRNIYSTDNGATWDMVLFPDYDGAGGPDRDGVEGAVAERLDGTVLRNDRPGGFAFPNDPYRTTMSGPLLGPYSQYQFQRQLTEPNNPANTENPGKGSQGSLLRYNFDGTHRVMFLHPADPLSRTDMKLWISYDDGDTWTQPRDIPRPTGWGTSTDLNEGGYSSMAKTSDYHVAALIEGSKTDPDPDDAQEKGNKKEHFIVFHKFNLSWILNGRSEPLPQAPYH